MSEWRFYVYELVDPRDGSVFYVGKGTGSRIDQHEKDSANGVSSKKCNKIRSIVSKNLAVIKRKVAYFANEQDAYEFEAARIKEYGMANLTNVAPLPDEEPKAVLNPFLSEAFMKIMAIGYRSTMGIHNDYTGRPFATVLHNAFMRRFEEFEALAIRKVGRDALRAGVARFGIDLHFHGG